MPRFKSLDASIKKLEASAQVIPPQRWRSRRRRAPPASGKEFFQGDVRRASSTVDRQPDVAAHHTGEARRRLYRPAAFRSSELGLDGAQRRRRRPRSPISNKLGGQALPPDARAAELHREHRQASEILLGDARGGGCWPRVAGSLPQGRCHRASASSWERTAPSCGTLRRWRLCSQASLCNTPSRPGCRCRSASSAACSRWRRGSPRRRGRNTPPRNVRRH